MAMSIEDQLKNKFEELKELTENTGARGYIMKFAAYSDDIERASFRCQFSRVAANLRAIGEEQILSNEYLGKARKENLIPRERIDKIEETLNDFVTLTDKMAAENMVDSCNCRADIFK